MLPPSTEPRKHSVHTIDRFFIGPLPERVLSHTEHLVQKPVNTPRRLFSSESRQRTSDDDGTVEELIKQYAYAFHLKLGGSEEDWNEERENSVMDEMSREWRESPWGRLWRGRKDGSNTPNARWVLPNDSGSFQIGEFLGLNTYAEQASRKSAANGGDGLSFEAGPSTSRQVHNDEPSVVTGDTFVTAPELDTTPSQSSSAMGASRSSTNDLLAHTSTTSLLQVSATDWSPGRSRTRTGPTSDKAKGKAKKVVRLHDPSTAAPAGEVLQQTGSETQETSAAAAEFQADATSSALVWDVPDEYEDAKMKDRMIVRVAYCKDGSLGSHFDEMQDRSVRDMQYEDWAEFMVIWRSDRLELYNDFRFPGREWVAGHKHLAFVVPLKNARTNLSLYSFTDMSFCVTCPPASLRAGVKILLPFQRRTGTNVYIFKARCRSRAIDWIWRLWREMDGKLPPFIEVHSPIIDARMKIDIPEGADYSFFCHDNIVTLCMKTLSTVQDWHVIMEKRLADGAHMELAWRLDTSLDWVWWQDDIRGNPRTWAVLAGLALNQAGKAAHLEVRLAEHMTRQLHIKDGDHLSEPPSIEGYVTRVRGASGTQEEVYLTVHNGLLFTLGPAQAHAPNPPGILTINLDSNRDPCGAGALRQEEVRRGVAQVSAARGVTDLRAVMAVRRAFRPQFQPRLPAHDRTLPNSEEAERDLEVEIIHEESDAQDVGGDAGLSGGEVSMIRMRRCFELLMKTGHVVRFETWSAQVAIEWIERLRALVRYWKLRHVVDTRQEMDVVQFAAGRPRITPLRLRDDEEDKNRPPEPPINPAIALPYLSSIYHWCVYEGCRPITKSARIYVRQGLQGEYKLVQMFLVAGQLVQFHIKPKSTLYRRKGKTVSLVDAYIVSGVLAAQALPKGQYNPNNPSTPRRYADGLESNDAEENTLFVVYYVPHKATQTGRVPSLNAAKKTMVFRCRSRVERDVWCWALNTEIEKLARGKRDREEKWRNVGAPIPHRELS